MQRTVSKPALTIAGTAVFKACELGVSFEERGAYMLNDVSQPYYQRRFFLFEKTELKILKEDRSPLHAFSLKNVDPVIGASLTHTHVCKDDSYKTELIIESMDTFIWCYHVVGPKKDYEIYSVYERQN